jgi:hypothetical protein
MKSWFELYDLKEARELAKKHGTAVLNEMHYNIADLDLVDKGNLLNSLKVSIRTKSGEVAKIEFQYEWYGIVQERGAENLFGKGINLQPSVWRDNAIDLHQEEVEREFSEFYAEIALKQIEIDPIKFKL